MARLVSEYDNKREQDRVLGSEKEREVKKLKSRVEELEDDLEKK
jgi:hypothetical protein